LLYYIVKNSFVVFFCNCRCHCHKCDFCFDQQAQHNVDEGDAKDFIDSSRHFDHLQCIKRREGV